MTEKIEQKGSGRMKRHITPPFMRRLIDPTSYWTEQLTTSHSEEAKVRALDKLGRLREPKTIDVILKTMSTNDLMRVHAGKAIESILLRKDYVKEIIGTEIYSALTKGVN